MRTLKFRYWNTITKEMVNNPKMPYKENWTIEQLFEDRGWVWMQFTGLIDRHGVEIYEDDIVYLAGYGDYEVTFPFIQLYEAAAEGDIGEIKGNKWENPELLEVGE